MRCICSDMVFPDDSSWFDVCPIHHPKEFERQQKESQNYMRQNFIIWLIFIGGVILFFTHFAFLKS